MNIGRHCCLIIATVAGFSNFAIAGEVPRYNVEAHCKAVASFGGDYSASLDNACFQQEQEAYNGLAATWSTVKPEMAAHCDQVARFGGDGSYGLLQACIGQEAEASGQVNVRKFKY